MTVIDRLKAWWKASHCPDRGQHSWHCFRSEATHQQRPAYQVAHGGGLTRIECQHCGLALTGTEMEAAYCRWSLRDYLFSWPA